ncbi:hypothetical protein PILCRDRAFT_179362 [Piloderma croceum F 1598]|uniref:Uncharacterized protein n=1 Tax=Piloderma croceum (strain F 1598) TaxID=765440 RepID=A0A0C3CKV1_PILCF|nr:hypothetical protein PILCRDRAFT_179362 [Piloderma croceum F 1598]
MLGRKWWWGMPYPTNATSVPLSHPIPPHTPAPSLIAIRIVPPCSGGVGIPVAVLGRIRSRGRRRVGTGGGGSGGDVVVDPVSVDVLCLGRGRGQSATSFVRGRVLEQGSDVHWTVGGGKRRETDTESKAEAITCLILRLLRSQTDRDRSTRGRTSILLKLGPRCSPQIEYYRAGWNPTKYTALLPIRAMGSIFYVDDRISDLPTLPIAAASFLFYLLITFSPFHM